MTISISIWELKLQKGGGGGEYANGSAEFENIFARISDSKGDFNGFPDPAIAVDCGFI